MDIEEVLLHQVNGLGRFVDLPDDLADDGTAADARVYEKSDNALLALSDLSRSLRRDNAETRDVRRLLGRWRVWQLNLVPLMAAYRDDTQLVVGCLKLLFTLSMPVAAVSGGGIMSAPAADQLRYLQDYKESFVMDASSTAVLVDVLAEAVQREAEAPNELDAHVIELVCFVLRNLAAVPDPPPSRNPADHARARLHERFLARCADAMVFELLLFMTESLGTAPAARKWLLLELFAFLFRGAAPDTLFDYSTDRIEASNGKATTSTEHDELLGGAKEKDAEAEPERLAGAAVAGEAVAGKTQQQQQVPLPSPSPNKKSILDEELRDHDESSNAADHQKGVTVEKSERSLSALLAQDRARQLTRNRAVPPRHSRFGGSFALIDGKGLQKAMVAGSLPQGSSLADDLRAAQVATEQLSAGPAAAVNSASSATGRAAAARRVDVTMADDVAAAADGSASLTPSARRTLAGFAEQLRGQPFTALVDAIEQEFISLEEQQQLAQLTGGAIQQQMGQIFDSDKLNFLWLVGCMCGLHTRLESDRLRRLKQKEPAKEKDEAATQKQSAAEVLRHAFDARPVGAALSRRTIDLTLQLMARYQEAQAYVPLAAVMRAFTELLGTCDAVMVGCAEVTAWSEARRLSAQAADANNDEDVENVQILGAFAEAHEAARAMLLSVFYQFGAQPGQDLRSQLLRFRASAPGSRVYLITLAEAIHVYLHALQALLTANERVYRRKRKAKRRRKEQRKKKVEEEEKVDDTKQQSKEKEEETVEKPTEAADATPPVVVAKDGDDSDDSVDDEFAEAELSYEDTLAGFAHNSTVFNYAALLHSYSSNSPRLNHVIVKMFDRIAFQCRMYPVFYQLSLLRLFQRILRDPATRTDSSLKEILLFSRCIVRRFFSELRRTLESHQEDGAQLAVESLFWRPAATNLELGRSRKDVEKEREERQQWLERRRLAEIEKEQKRLEKQLEGKTKKKKKSQKRRRDDAEETEESADDDSFITRDDKEKADADDSSSSDSEFEARPEDLAKADGSKSSSDEGSYDSDSESDESEAQQTDDDNDALDSEDGTKRDRKRLKKQSEVKQKKREERRQRRRERRKRRRIRKADGDGDKKNPKKKAKRMRDAVRKKAQSAEAVPIYDDDAGQVWIPFGVAIPGAAAGATSSTTTTTASVDERVKSKAKELALENEKEEEEEAAAVSEPEPPAEVLDELKESLADDARFSLISKWLMKYVKMALLDLERPVGCLVTEGVTKDTLNHSDILIAFSSLGLRKSSGDLGEEFHIPEKQNEEHLKALLDALEGVVSS